MDGSPHSFTPNPTLPAKRKFAADNANQRSSSNNQSPVSIPSFASSRPNSVEAGAKTTLHKSDRVLQAQEGIWQALAAFFSVVEEEQLSPALSTELLNEVLKGVSKNLDSPNRDSTTSLSSFSSWRDSFPSSLSSRTSGSTSSLYSSTRSVGASKSSTYRSPSDIQSFVSTPADHTILQPPSHTTPPQPRQDHATPNQQESGPVTPATPARDTSNKSDVACFCTSPYCPKANYPFRKPQWLAHEKIFHEREKVFVCCGAEYGRKHDFQDHHKRKHEECFKAPCYHDPPHEGKCTCKCTHAEPQSARVLPKKSAWGCAYCETCSPTLAIHFSHIFERHYNISIPSQRKTRDDQSNSTIILSLLRQEFTAKDWKSLKKSKNCSGISWDRTDKDDLLNLKRLLEETTHGDLDAVQLTTIAFNSSNLGQAEACRYAEQRAPAKEPIPHAERQVAQQHDPTYAEPLDHDLRDPRGHEILITGPSQVPYTYEPIPDYEQFLYQDESNFDQRYPPLEEQEALNTNQHDYNQNREQYGVVPQIDLVPNPNEPANDDRLVPVVNDPNGERSAFDWT